MGVLIGILVVCGVFLIVVFGVFGVLSVQETGVKKEKFDLEFYKRCQRAGIGNAVKTESEVQKAAEIAQKMATEKEFLRKIEKRHLKARCLNERLNNGGVLFAQETRVKEQKNKVEAEKSRMFEALPHKHWSHSDSTYTLEKNTVQIVEKYRGGIEDVKTFWISSMSDVEIKGYEFGYMISFRGDHFSDSIFSSGEVVTPEQMVAIYKYLVKCSAIPEEVKGSRLLYKSADLVAQRKKAELKAAQSLSSGIYGYHGDNSPSSTPSSYGSKGKDASVVGRAVAGTIIAGPVGGVIGALSAVDKNNRNRK